jgi:hypothetical protein
VILRPSNRSTTSRTARESEKVFLTLRGYLEKVSTILVAKLYLMCPKGKSLQPGVLIAFEHTARGGIKQAAVNVCRLGLMRETWRAWFRKGVTVGNCGGLLIKSSASGSSKTWSKVSSLSGRHSLR